MNLNKTIIIILPLIYSSHVFSDETYYITPDETPFIAIEPDTIITSPSSFDQKISNHYVKLEKNKILLTDEIIEKLNKHIGNIKTTFGESITKENVKIKDSLIISPKDIEIRSKIASFFYNEIEGNLLGSNDAPHISFNKKAVLHFLAEHTNDDIQIAQTTLPNLTIKQYDDIVHGEKNNVIKQGDLFSIENEFNKKIITLIKKNNVELSKFDNQIKLNKMMSKVNQSGHAMNLERILANEDNIDANKKDIDTNKESIDANKEDIDTNRIGTDTNRKDIDINKEDIDNIKDNYIDNLNINGNNISLKNHFATLYMEQSISRSEVKTLKNDFEHFKSDTQNRFYKVEKRANQGIASVAAMSNLPFTDSATFSTAIGIGNYRNATALAWGMQYRINENIKIRASTAWNESSWVSAGGVGISW